jgi:hypothetical protein
MIKYTQEDFDALPFVDGVKQCPTGDYTAIKRFNVRCTFGKSCIFTSSCTFVSSCTFGLNCNFGSRCYFYEFCSFGKFSSFGELCFFNNGCEINNYRILNICVLSICYGLNTYLWVTDQGYFIQNSNYSFISEEDFLTIYSKNTREHIAFEALKAIYESQS